MFGGKPDYCSKVDKDLWSSVVFDEYFSGKWHIHLDPNPYSVVSQTVHIKVPITQYSVYNENSRSSNP